jgi:hypothetical protein
LRSASVLALCARASSVSLVFCAPSCVAATSSLKAWTRALGLPRGKLHGVADSGALFLTLPPPPSPYANAPPPPPPPPPKADDTPLIIKYSSSSAAGGGDAHACPYGGEYRGVLLTPVLADAAVRQYGYLPLRLFDDDAGDDDEGGDAGLGGTVRTGRTASPTQARAAVKARSGSAGPGGRRPPLSGATKGGRSAKGK